MNIAGLFSKVLPEQADHLVRQVFVAYPALNTMIKVR